MTTTKGRVIHLYQRDPQEALERLNRITGLCFVRWPESLAQPALTDASAEPQQPAEPLIGRGLESA